MIFYFVYSSLLSNHLVKCKIYLIIFADNIIFYDTCASVVTECGRMCVNIEGLTLMFLFLFLQRTNLS